MPYNAFCSDALVYAGQGATIIDVMSTLAVMGELDEFKKAAGDGPPRARL